MKKGIAMLLATVMLLSCFGVLPAMAAEERPSPMTRVCLTPIPPPSSDLPNQARRFSAGFSLTFLHRQAIISKLWRVVGVV